MAASNTRIVLRQTCQLSRRSALRYNSTASKATEAAKETASKATDKTSEFTSKASEGLSRVTSTAGPALSRAGSGVLNALGRVGGRTGKVVAFVERSIPPTVYYARVGLELAKLVFRGRNMSLPSVKVWEQYYQKTLELVRNRQLLQQQVSKLVDNSAELTSRIRNLNAAQIAGGAVVGAEILGFFTVGEIIGRMKLVGYRGPAESEH